MPQYREGRVIGIALFGIRPVSVFARLGLLNGDVLTRVNGESLTDPTKALAQLAALIDSKTGTVDIERHGTPMTVPYDLTDK